MQIECPACKQRLSARDGSAGRRVQCPKCKSIFSLQPPPPSSPPAEAAQLRRAGAPRLCPRCQTPLDPAAIICHRCGVNLQTGRTPADEAAEERRANAEGVPRFEPMQLLDLVEAVLPGLVRPGIVIRAVLFAIVGLFCLAMCAALTALGLVIESPFVGGLGLILYALAIAMLITGERGLPHELLSEFNGKQWLLFLALLFIPPIVAYFALRGYLPQPNMSFLLPGHLPQMPVIPQQPTIVP
jgi:uncharacterized Zn finger protein (UPF0148 family)